MKTVTRRVAQSLLQELNENFLSGFGYGLREPPNRRGGGLDPTAA